LLRKGGGGRGESSCLEEGGAGNWGCEIGGGVEERGVGMEFDVGGLFAVATLSWTTLFSPLFFFS